MKRKIALPVLLPALLSAGAQTTITVDMAKEAGRIPSLIYGAGAEDVNHEIYGGLYDQRIFGESFEEPTVSRVENFTSYDTPWSVDGDVLRLSTSGHGKIILQETARSNNSVEVDMRIDSPNAISGVIMNVSDAGNGADAFRGYEISFNAATRRLVIGKHEHNWQPVAEIPVEFTPAEWNHLRVDFDGAKATIWLNGTKIHEFEDTDNPITSGQTGLRSFDGSASFRNLRVNGTDIAINALPTGASNFRHYDNPWNVTDGQLSADAHAKAIYNSGMLQRGRAEVTLRHTDDRTIAGFIINTSEAGDGYDNFRGYEIGLSAPAKTLVVGKHDHNWQPIAEVPVTFNPAEWNKLTVDFDGAKMSIALNGAEVYNFNDTNSPIAEGKVGLRTFDGGAIFRDFTIDGADIAFNPMPTGVSRMWEPVGNGTYTHRDSGAFNGTYYQQITGTTGDGICNFGLNKWGIGVDSGNRLSGYVYLKGSADKAYVALQSADGTKEYGRSQITGVNGEWNKFEFDITPSATDHEARFVVGLDTDGSLDVDMAMLHTDSYPFRSDITEAFRKENLTFLRYGGTMINAPGYMTGNMMGPRDLRPPYIGHWYRNSTNGFGIIEFVDFARMIGTEPTFAINIEDNPTDVLALLKEIEHHDLKYIEIGNEENIFDESFEAYEHFVERFNVLYDAIHPVYPDLVFINAAWWRPNHLDWMKYVFENVDGKSLLWDYHPWTDEVNQAKAVETDLKNMQRLFKEWNPATDMHIAILEENGNTHCMHRALSHAVVLNIVRKMNGFVELDSPANALQPYRQNDNGWDQGQIFFNSHMTWCQPPYYAQQMAASHHQPIALDATFRNGSLNVSATRNEEGDKMVIHIVNSNSKPVSVKIDLQNGGDVKSVNGVSLAGDLQAINTPDEPERIVPREFTLTTPEVSLEPYSYTILELTCDGVDGISEVTSDSNHAHASLYYNLSGHATSTPDHGIYVTDKGEKIAL